MTKEEAKQVLSDMLKDKGVDKFYEGLIRLKNSSFISEDFKATAFDDALCGFLGFGKYDIQKDLKLKDVPAGLKDWFNKNQDEPWFQPNVPGWFLEGKVDLSICGKVIEKIEAREKAVDKTEVRGGVENVPAKAGLDFSALSKQVGDLTDMMKRMMAQQKEDRESFQQEIAALRKEIAERPLVTPGVQLEQQPQTGAYVHPKGNGKVDEFLERAMKGALNGSLGNNKTVL